MRALFLLSVALASIAALAPATAAEPENTAPTLTDANLQTWLDYIRPKKEELGYRAIPWQRTLWDAVVEAQRADKPILLWAMNGHPLACT
jgi:hypothetical protein